MKKLSMTQNFIVQHSHDWPTELSIHCTMPKKIGVEIQTYVPLLLCVQRDTTAPNTTPGGFHLLAHPHNVSALLCDLSIIKWELFTITLYSHYAMHGNPTGGKATRSRSLGQRPSSPMGLYAMGSRGYGAGQGAFTGYICGHFLCLVTRDRHYSA